MHIDRKAIGHLAKVAGMRALVIDYRLAPEHKFPAQIDAVEFATRAQAAGVDVELRVLPAGQHNVILGAGRVPEVGVAVRELAEWLRSKFGIAAAL